ncbi:polymeric immunoglobulin receptor-like [Carassius auratus]|uniref:polymeric immunoglobulin receptor-like n=1 Tax=Carassius auratus TaxID=7957 RepID=UPI000E41DA65|nr:polymeric immunoglobulin receptor-like [Carassius auratus]
MDLNCLLFIFSFFRLSGAQGITTVSQISARRGQSVIIPCLYNHTYAFSYKYLSVGDYWLSSVQTYHYKTSDDTKGHIFTVHMDDVQEPGYYWCTIHIPLAFDIYVGFFLDITPDSPRLYVNSQIVTGSENGSVTITCYHQGAQYGVKWCKFGDQCITGASGTLAGASVKIIHGLRNTTVRMSQLKKENTGWYWCSTEDLQMPVHITVHQKESSKTTAEPGQFSPSTRKRTAIFFLMPVILEIILLTFIYLALKLARFCKRRFLQSVNEAEGGPYVTMHREQSLRSNGCSAAEGVYENMAELSEIPASSHKSTGLAVVKKTDSSNASQQEPDYVNIMKT